MKKILAVIGLCAFFCAGCDNGGLFGGGYAYPEEDALELTLAVYTKMNDYAVRGPGSYGDTVAVSDDYGSDTMNALYWNEVTLEFDNFFSPPDLTINGKSIVKAIMDSYDGKYVIEYSGTLTGEYLGEGYKLVINFKTEWSTSFTSEGTFTVNGKKYTFDVDSSDALPNGSIPT